MPVYHFLLANNDNLCPISHSFQVIVQYWSNFLFHQRVPLFTALVLGNLCEYHNKTYTTAKFRLLEPHFYRIQYGSNFTTESTFT